MKKVKISGDLVVSVFNEKITGRHQKDFLKDLEILEKEGKDIKSTLDALNVKYKYMKMFTDQKTPDDLPVDDINKIWGVIMETLSLTKALDFTGGSQSSQPQIQST